MRRKRLEIEEVKREVKRDKKGIWEGKEKRQEINGALWEEQI